MAAGHLLFFLNEGLCFLCAAFQFIKPSSKGLSLSSEQPVAWHLVLV